MSNIHNMQELTRKEHIKLHNTPLNFYKPKFNPTNYPDKWRKYNWKEAVAHFGILLLACGVILVNVLAVIQLYLFDLI